MADDTKANETEREALITNKKRKRHEEKTEKGLGAGL